MVQALELLRDIRDALRALPAEITAAIAQQDGVERQLSDADSAALTKLLPIIDAAVCGRPFTIEELKRHAALNVAPALALRAALEATNTRAVGRLLRRGCDIRVAGYRIVEVAFTRVGVRWAVECDNRLPHKHATFASPVRIRR